MLGCDTCYEPEEKSCFARLMLALASQHLLQPRANQRVYPGAGT